MEVRDEEKFNLLRVNSIEIWQLLDTLTTWVQAAIQHNFPAFALKVDAAATDLAPRPKRCDLKDLTRLSLDGVCYTHL